MNKLAKLVNSIHYYNQYKQNIQLLAYFENEISEEAKLRNSVRRYIIVRRLMTSRVATAKEKIELIYQTVNYTRPQGLSFDARYQLESLFSHYHVALY